MKKFNYESDIYLKKLDELSSNYYSKYIKFLKRYSQKRNRILDVGCGNGHVLGLINACGYSNTYGVDISKFLIKVAKKRGIKNVHSYDGKTLPFNNNYFDVIGSFNVLEHTQDPNRYIKEQVKKLKKGGVIVVACPNFLSTIFPNTHPKVRGFRNKYTNFVTILKKIFLASNGFIKMDPIIRKKFEYDDDAIVVTNTIDIVKSLNNTNCDIIYTSGFINRDGMVFNLASSIPVVKYMLPSCFVVARKK